MASTLEPEELIYKAKCPGCTNKMDIAFQTDPVTKVIVKKIARCVPCGKVVRYW